MSTTFTLILIAVGVTVALIASRKTNKKTNNNSSKNDDPYNGFHLGEMTRHDIPADVAKREKEYAKWSARQVNKTAESKNKEDDLWKRK